ncbi:AAA family ATPase [[Clostridium] innocuum]|uniref:AAA family ATPase n=2 Tax=Clostridium innocuum TaxID=1522 RepID=UPI000D79C32B|nr:AAA family ATPase [[Clostridium] innocuum]PWJ18860.1 Cdc48 subfamily AAA family protein [[Clostridium] innocuum]SSA39633.1 AAA domain (Cdc48 subfamily) [[Clostridium] innocuum]
MKKKLLYYEKGSFDEFVKKFSKGEDNVYSISYLTDKNIALRYTAINGVEHFIIDITVMVMSALARNDLRIIYESWISLLNEENESNIDYCVEKSFLSEACDIFSYYFERNEECDKVMSQIEEIKEDNNEESKIFSIVNCDKNEFNSVVEQFEKQLYGHENFKENFKKQLEAFILLNKMKRRKVFSLLICGKSGVGKTEVGRILQRQMYPDDLPIKINFGNYSGKGSLWSLIGSPKGYVGSEQGGELTNKILHSKSKIIVIDELDKADEAIFTFFYEMLEDGQYTDLDGKVINLDGYIIVFTANLNNKNFKDMIPEPLFSRFDMTYEFQPLSYTDKLKFITDFTDKLLKDYKEHIGGLDEFNIKKQIIEKNYQISDNLRNIKRKVMNDFVELVGEESAWK